MNVERCDAEDGLFLANHNIFGNEHGFTSHAKWVSRIEESLQKVIHAVSKTGTNGDNI